MEDSEKEKINHICLTFIALCVFTVALTYTKAILVPFVLSLFLYASLVPVFKFFEDKMRMNRVVVVPLTFTVLVLLATIVILLIASSLENFIIGAGAYRDKLLFVVKWFSETLKLQGFEMNSSTIQNAIQDLPVFTWTRKITGGIFNLVGNILLIFIFLLFLIIGSKGTQAKKSQIVEEIELRIGKYVNTKLVTSFVTATLVGIVLVSFKVDLAFMFILITFFFNFIPNIGSILSTLIPLPIVFLQYGGFSVEFAVIFILIALVQFSIGNVIEPK